MTSPPILCPECGRPEEQPRRRRGVAGIARALWPVWLAAAIAAAVWWWAPRDRLVGSVSTGAQHPLRGPITVADLQRMVSKEDPVDRLREAVLDRRLGRGFIPELTRVSATKEKPEPPQVEEAVQWDVGWPSAWATARHEPANQTLLLWGQPGWWWQAGWSGVGFGNNGAGAAGSWGLRLNLLRLGGDLLLPALALAAAGCLRGRARWWARVAAVGAGVAAVAALQAPDPSLTPVSRPACSLSSTLAQIRAQVVTDEGCWALAFSLLGAVGERDETAGVILILDASVWREADRVSLPGPIGVVERSDVACSGSTPRLPLLQSGIDGFSVSRRAAPNTIRRWEVSWEGLGLVAGVPAVCWLLWSVARRLWVWRLDRRVRRGLCRACGYDLRGLGRG